MKIASIQVVSVFQENRQAILAGGQKFLALAKKLNARVQQVNLPEVAPPDSPRLLFQRADLMAAMSFARLTVTARPPSHVAGDFAGAVDFAQRSAQPIVAELVEIDQQYLWGGIIVNLEYILAEKGVRGVVHAQQVFDRMLKIDRAGRELGAFQLHFGFQEQGVYKGFVVRGYETRMYEVMGSTGITTLSLDEGEIEGSGIEIIVDINNKREVDHGSATDDVTRLFSEHKTTHTTMLDVLNLRGVLDGELKHASKTAA